MVWICALPLSPDGAAQQRDARERLREAILRELASPLFARTVAAVEVSDLRTGAVLFEQQSRLLLRPASNVKLFTTAAAFARFPAGFAFSTDAFVEAVSDSVPRVWIRGAGDPLVSSKDIQKLAEKIRAAGVERAADIAYDGSVFDTLRFAPGWMWDDLPEEFAPWLSAFPFGRNTLDVAVEAPAKAGAPLTATVLPGCAPVTVDLRATAGRGEKLSAVFSPETDRITVTGTLAPGGRREFSFTLHKPHETFHCTLLAALAAAGVEVASRRPAIGVVPRNLTPCASVTHSLDDVAALTNKRSDNLCAESLLKALAAQTNGRPGSTEAGIAAVRASLGALGVDTTSIALVDGSGSSFYNLASAASLGAALRAMHRHAESRRFIESLATPGGEGTMSRRLSGMRGSEWVRAKTGTIRGVSALSGYILPPEGTPLVFVVLMQNFTGDHAPYRAVQDRVVMHCIEYSASRRAVTPSR